MFEWLNAIFESLISFFPHRLIVKSTHAGVKWKYGRKILPVNPGICWYWPLVTEVIVVPVVRQTTNLPEQVLSTIDGQTVAVNGIVIYEVKDAVALLTETWDYDTTIQDFGIKAIKSVLCTSQFEYFQTNVKEADRLLTRALRKDLKRFGIRTIRVSLTDFTKCRALALWSAGKSAVKANQ